MRKFEAIKKVELHCHLDGSLDIELAAHWLGKTKEEAKNELCRSAGVRSLTEYLKKFDLPISLLQLKTHLKEASNRLCKAMKKENVIYAEIRFAPLCHLKKGLSLEEVIDSCLSGIKASELKANLILTMKRESSLKDNKKIIDLAKKYLGKGVCAVDLAGDESLYPTSLFSELFEYAKKKDVPFTIHAGEAGTYADVDSAISFGAKRIGHGVQSIKNFKTMEGLKKNKIPLEICVTSNIDIHLYENIKEHPISRLIDSGILVTINTDNRTISKTDLSHEYYLLNKYFGFNKEDFNKMNLIAIEHAFISEDEKKELIKQLI